MAYHLKHYAQLNNITVSNSTVKFVGSLSSSVQVTNIQATNMTIANHLIGFIDCFDVEMHDIYIDNIHSEYDYLMLVSNTKVNSILNVTIKISILKLYILEDQLLILSVTLISTTLLKVSKSRVLT